MNAVYALKKGFGQVLALVPFRVVPGRWLRRMRQASFVVTVSRKKAAFYSQYGQDQFLWNQVFNRRPATGFFLDIGAYDGVTFSNSCFFEQTAGWNGLLIEPNPVAFDRIKSSRNVEAVNCGIALTADVMTFIQCDGYGEQLSCIAEFATEEHLSRIDRERESSGFQVRRISVPVRPIADILDERSIRRIDVLSVDVEGMELVVLGAMPFETVYVSAVVAESNAPVELEALMEKKGFSLRAIVGTDHIYLNHDFQPPLEKVV